MKKIISFVLGWFYHPILHRWRHREEYKRLRPVLQKSLSQMNEMRIQSPASVASHALAGKTAIQIHMFYTDLLDEFYRHLKGITVPYDLFISTDTKEKQYIIEDFFSNHGLPQGKLVVETFENRGRDVYPFLAQMYGRLSDYEYVAHFHTKKSSYTKGGDSWRQELLKSLLGNGDRFNKIIRFFEANCSYGLVIPEIPKTHGLRWGYARTKTDQWNQDSVKNELESLGVGTANFDLRNYEHSAGTMFVARVKSVHQIFEHEFRAEDFPDEKGQLKHTLQHALELVWHPVCVWNGYRMGVI